MSKIIEAIEAKQSELEQRKKDMQQAVDDVLSTYRENTASYIAELQVKTEKSMTELQRQHAQELKAQTSKIKASYRRQMMALWFFIVALIAAFGVSILMFKEAAERINIMDNRQQWLWIVNEDAIKAKTEELKSQQAK